MADTAVQHYPSPPPRSGGLGRQLTFSAPTGSSRASSDSATGKRTSPGVFDRPAARSGHRVGTPGVSTAVAERLTPMPEYMHPIERSAATRWQKLHEDHMMQKLLKKRAEKKKQNHYTKKEAHKIARKIPMEILARDWFKDQAATVEMRAILVDKILPTLIIGVEKMLIEVDKRGLADQDTENPLKDFNPINYLAQYLMKNNPRFSNFSEASPYIRGLREVSEELKVQMFDIDENRMARIKSEAREKREKRELAEHLKSIEKYRREIALQKQYGNWDVGKYPDGRVELALLQNALRSFMEVSVNFPEELRSAATYSHVLETTDDTGRTLAQREFIEYISQYIDEMPSEVFDQFITHLHQCAMSHKLSIERESRRTLLQALFIACDNTGVGLLDRHRILNLFEMFYDKSHDKVKQILRNPRKWPVVDMIQIDTNLEYSDDEDDVPEEAEAAETGEEPAVERTEGDGQEPTDQIVDDVNATEGETVKNEEGVTDVENKEDKMEEKLEDQNNNEDDHTDNDAGKSDTVAEEGAEEVPSDIQEPPGENKEEEVRAETVADDVAGDEPPKPSPEAALPPVKEHPEEDDVPLEGSTAERDDAEGGQEKVVLPRLLIQRRQPVAKKPELASLSEEGGAVTAGTVGRPPATQQSKVSFAEGTTFERERTIHTSHGSRSQSQTSAFDENVLNVSQFTQVTETFLGDEPNTNVFSDLSTYVREGYVETEEERYKRMIKVQREAEFGKRKALLSSLFEMWDNDGSGFIELSEVEEALKKFKDGTEKEAVELAKKEFRRRSRHLDNRLMKREFREYIQLTVQHMEGGDWFDMVVEFLVSGVERSYAERIRGEARKKWLQQITITGETSGANMDPVYKSVFQAMYKDAETHGSGKVISAYVALLERNDSMDHSGPNKLRYVAATTDHAQYLLNRELYKDMKGISFASVDSGKPIHVPRVNNHGNIMFWNADRSAENRDGSLIIVPLKDIHKRVFGLIGIDTLNDPASRAIFITHEIQFYQGVAKAFSIAYHHVDVKQKTMRISESAVSWVHRRCPHVTDIVVYMVEPDPSTSRVDQTAEDYVLRRMITTDHRGSATILANPPRLDRKDNLFRDYLFKCVDNSESLTADAYGQRHLAVPLRDDVGVAIVVIDISIGDLRELPRQESREVMKMMKLLQTAYKEITQQARQADGDESIVESSAEILFDRLMLLELRGNVSKLDPKCYAELKSYNEPPETIANIMRSVLAMFYPEKALEGEFEAWSNCRQYITPELSQLIIEFDPTVDNASDGIPLEYINAALEEVPHGSVLKQSSVPAFFFYNWVFVCASLVEHMWKTRGVKRERPPSTKPTREATKVEPSTEQSIEPTVKPEQVQETLKPAQPATEGEAEIQSEVTGEQGQIKDTEPEEQGQTEELAAE